MTHLLAFATDVVSNLETKQIAVLTLFLPAFFLIRWAYNGYVSYIDVPAVGVPPGILGRWKAPYQWRERSQHLIDEGMAKYGVHGKPFKISTPSRWMVFVTDPTVLNELKYISPTIMSFRRAADKTIGAKYTFHEDVMSDQWHLEMIRKNVTDKVAKDLSQIANEVVTAWGDNTNIGNEWTEINPWSVMLKIVTRATNRVLVGLPLCRNDEFLESVVDFVMNVVSAGNKLDLVPSVFHKLTVKYLLTTHEKLLATVMKHVGPVFEERRQQMKDEKWNAGNAPNDAIQWILDIYPPGASIRVLTQSLIFLQFASIHTSAITVVQLLFDLSANPQYQAPLRDEIEAQLHDRGLTVQALANMKKVDSFLRESARLNGTNIFTLLREVMVPHTFSDGTHVTKGAWIAAPAVCIHRWDKFYENPNVFNGFRFYEMRKGEGNATKFQNVTTSPEFLPFGDGPYACPGRFFATNELKVILGFLVPNYEFKFEAGVKRPANLFEGVASFPDPRVGILVRKRKDVKSLPFFSDEA